MFRLKFDKFESSTNLKMVNVFQDKTQHINLRIIFKSDIYHIPIEK